LRVALYGVLGLVAIGVGIVLLPSAIILVFGIAIPGVVILGLPLRILERAAKGRLQHALALSCLLLPWAYFLWPIIQNGYVSEKSSGTGPTVDPWTWTYIGIAWCLVELVYFSQRRHSHTSPSSAGRDDA
jgi:hypothetical protein